MSNARQVNGASAAGRHHQQLVCLITGCSNGGIGYELAKAFASKGCTVFASARRVQAMAGLAECGIQLLQLDVTDAASVSAAVSNVVSSAGRIDILVNNAGQWRWNYAWPNK